MATPEKTKPKAAERATSYMVLVRTSAGSWAEAGGFDGLNAQHAIRNAVKTGIDGETFIAVPMRSWKPMTRKVEQVTKEIWS